VEGGLHRAEAAPGRGSQTGLRPRGEAQARLIETTGRPAIRSRGRIAIVSLLCTVLAGCGGTGGATETTAFPPTIATAAPTTASRAATAPPATAAVPAPVETAPTCPAGAANCTAASGRVLALESVDPDGDGDLHLVLVSEQSVTLPGITVLDIAKDLRPAVDPKAGDWAAGAGPVYRGSHGQRQIQVERVVYAPTR
jgi:hypothetical protein